MTKSRSGGLARAAAAVLAAALCACRSGPSAGTKKAVNSLIAAQNYAGAEAYLQSNKESQYGRKNMVLYYLDEGTILHHAGKYRESDASFDKAESRMDELYTVSMTKAGGMLLLNDNTADYAGEPFERALMNVMRALNFVSLGKLDEALVESRKVELFLDELNGKLEGKSRYKDDAFARYLDALLYADIGQADDARISMHAATEAYAWYASDYHIPTPRFDLPNVVGRDTGELVLIHFNGVAPRKISKTLQLAWGNAVALTQTSGDAEANGAPFKNALTAGLAGNAITIAYPEYVQDPYKIADSEVFVDSAPAGSTQLVEDVTAIAMKNLTDRQALIRTRAIARATVKFVLASSAAKAAGALCDRQFGSGSIGSTLCKTAARGVAQGIAAATEVADVRSWSTLPSQIRMARISLAPGRHQVRVRFKDGAGTVVSNAVFNDVVIHKGKRTYLDYRTGF